MLGALGLVDHDLNAWDLTVAISPSRSANVASVLAIISSAAAAEYAPDSSKVRVEASVIGEMDERHLDKA